MATQYVVKQLLVHLFVGGYALPMRGPACQAKAINSKSVHFLC